MRSQHEDYELDPVYTNAKREAKFILSCFAVFAVYTLSTCYGLGWHPDRTVDPEPSMLLGIPSWVFWGILIPWLFATVVTGWFCFRFMRDDAITDTQEAEAASGGGTSTGVDSDPHVTSGERDA